MLWKVKSEAEKQWKQDGILTPEKSVSKSLLASVEQQFLHALQPISRKTYCKLQAFYSFVEHFEVFHRIPPSIQEKVLRND